MFVARNRTTSSPASQANSIDDVIMRRRISPFAPMLQLMLVLVDWCTARLVLRAVSGVRCVFMDSMINFVAGFVHVQISENRT